MTAFTTWSWPATGRRGCGATSSPESATLLKLVRQHPGQDLRPRLVHVVEVAVELRPGEHLGVRGHAEIDELHAWHAGDGRAQLLDPLAMGRLVLAKQRRVQEKEAGAVAGRLLGQSPQVADLARGEGHLGHLRGGAVLIERVEHAGLGG